MLADLHDEAFVLFPRRPRPAYCDRIMEVRRQEGFTPKQPVMSQYFQTAVSLVSVGVGISVVPDSVSQSKISGIAFRPYIGVICKSVLNFTPDLIISPHTCQTSLSF